MRSSSISQLFFTWWMFQSQCVPSHWRFNFFASFCLDDFRDRIKQPCFQTAWWWWGWWWWWSWWWWRWWCLWAYDWKPALFSMFNSIRNFSIRGVHETQALKGEGYASSTWASNDTGLMPTQLRCATVSRSNFRQSRQSCTTRLDRLDLWVSWTVHRDLHSELYW